MHHSHEAILEAGYRDSSTSLFLETRIVPTIFTEDKFLVTANAELTCRQKRRWFCGLFAKPVTLMPVSV